MNTKKDQVTDLETLKIQTYINGKKITPSSSYLPAKRQNQRHNLRIVIEKRKNTFKKATVRLETTFPTETMEAKRKWNVI